MINQLFRSKFESNLSPFIVFLAMNAMLGSILMTTGGASGFRAESEHFVTGISTWLLLICFVAGGLGLLRYHRERGSRLYAQLPVSSLQVRVAYWLHAGLYLCISSLVLLLIMLCAGMPTLFEMLRFTLLYFFHAGVLLAVISIVTSNTLRLIPEEIRKRTVVYFFLATFITFLFLFVIGFIVAAYISVHEGGMENWSLLTLLMMLLCAGLVALDIHLFSGKDNYLG